MFITTSLASTGRSSVGESVERVLVENACFLVDRDDHGTEAIWS